MLTEVALPILQDGMDELRLELIANQQAKGIRDTGASANSLSVTVESSDTSLSSQLWGFSRFRFQVNGSGPFRSGKPSRAFVEKIRLWSIRHGIEEGAAYPIARKIAREGVEVPNSHNDGQLVAEILNAKNVQRKIAPRLKAALFKEIRSQFSPLM